MQRASWFCSRITVLAHLPCRGHSEWWSIVRVDAHCTRVGAVCPACGARSSRIHSSYLRFPADAPSAGRRVALQLRVRRFRCGNNMCPRRTFAEQIPGLTRRHSQRTERVRSTLAAVGLALAGRAGARLGSMARFVPPLAERPVAGRALPLWGAGRLVV
ncbi:transposase family protein [Streptomyces piniterrae]|uniref:transposase family protein n=1 Tax=Streptomyces piniterrae TaxID=2571125 RepID=UPI002482CA45|nr:transposase family protein [Streptomyces piniterrae]